MVTRVLVVFRCTRPDCTNTVRATPDSTATCGRHPRPAPMTIATTEETAP
jgi:hypothetical protein